MLLMLFLVIRIRISFSWLVYRDGSFQYPLTKLLYSYPVRSHLFAEIDHEIISTGILLPFTDSRGAAISYKRKYVYEILVNCLVTLAWRKKVWLGELTAPT